MKKKVRIIYTVPCVTVAPYNTGEQVTIGLQQSYYSSIEGNGPVEICIATLSGDFNGNNFTINYSIIDGQAEGIIITIIDMYMCVTCTFY